MDTQTSLEIQGATQQWVASLMNQYGISAIDMVEALTKVSSILKDQIITDLLSQIAQQEQQHAAEHAMMEQAPIEEQDNPIEQGEEDGGRINNTGSELNN